MFFRWIWLILTLPLLVCAQDDLLNDDEISVEAGDYLNRLQQIAENPFDLNRVSERRMLDIPFVDRTLARRIAVRRKRAPFDDVDELRTVEGISEELFQAIQPYFRVRSSRSGLSLKLEQRAAAIAHKARGYLNGTYGNRIAFRQRMMLNWNERAHLLLQSEKDAGERNWLDHFSGSLQLEIIGNITMLLLGDYYAVFGHGLIAAGAYGSRLSAGGGFSAFVPAVFRIRQKTGADETNFLRGAACVLTPGNSLQLFSAVSRRQLDGVFTDDSTSVKRLDNTGLHRTDTETARRNIQSETLFLAGASAEIKKLSVGLLWQRNEYRRPLRTAEGSVSGGDWFSAVIQSQGSFTASTVEVAMAQGRVSALGSLVLKSGLFQHGISAFHYSSRYFAPHGKQLGSFSSLPSNRRGVECVSSMNLPGRLKLSLRAGAAVPVRAEENFPLASRHTDALLQKAGEKTDLVLRYSARFSGGDVLYREGLQRRHRWRAEWHYQPDKALRLQQRIEYSRHSGRMYGVSLMHDIRYSFSRKNRIQFRYTHFDIPDFQLRHYEVETGLPGELESRLLNGRGYKWFFLLKFSPIEQLSFAMKYRVEYYPDEETIGSGNDLVVGNARRFLRGYMQIKL